MSVPPSTPNSSDRGEPPDSTRQNVPVSGTRRMRAASSSDQTQAGATQAVPSSRYAVPQQPPSDQYPPGQPPIDPNQPPYYPPPGQPPYYYPPPAPPASARRRARDRRPTDRRDSGLYLPWWSMLAMLVIVAGIGIGALVVVSTLGGQAPVGGTTPVFVVITATYTVGPPASATPIPQAATVTPPPALPTLAPSASLPPGNFAIGSTVKVVGTGDAGLNVRSGPGTANTRQFLAHDGDKFTLKEGPQDADGVEWWHITDPNNPNNDGWASRQFLTAISP